MNDILKIVKSLEDSGVLLKGVTEAIKNEAKEQSGGFLSMLLGTLASSLLTDMILNKKGKGVIRARDNSRDNLNDKVKDAVYVINLDEYSDIATHWIALHVNNETVTYFDILGVEHIPKKIKKFINNKNITTNIFRIQAYDSAM